MELKRNHFIPQKVLSFILLGKLESLRFEGYAFLGEVRSEQEESLFRARPLGCRVEPQTHFLGEDRGTNSQMPPGQPLRTLCLSLIVLNGLVCLGGGKRS